MTSHENINLNTLLSAATFVELQDICASATDEENRVDRSFRDSVVMAIRCLRNEHEHQTPQRKRLRPETVHTKNKQIAKESGNTSKISTTHSLKHVLEARNKDENKVDIKCETVRCQPDCGSKELLEIAGKPTCPDSTQSLLENEEIIYQKIKLEHKKGKSKLWEKNRRDTLRSHFKEIKDQLPLLRNDKKVTSLNILHNAIKYIQTLTCQERAFELEKKALRQEEACLKAKFINVLTCASTP